MKQMIFGAHFDIEIVQKLGQFVATLMQHSPGSNAAAAAACKNVLNCLT